MFICHRETIAPIKQDVGAASERLTRRQRALTRSYTHIYGHLQRMKTDVETEIHGMNRDLSTWRQDTRQRCGATHASRPVHFTNRQWRLVHKAGVPPCSQPQSLTSLTHFTVPRRVEGWVDLGTAVSVSSLTPTMTQTTTWKPRISRRSHQSLNQTLSQIRVTSVSCAVDNHHPCLALVPCGHHAQL